MLGPTGVREEHDGQPACAYTALPQVTVAGGRTGQGVLRHIGEHAVGSWAGRGSYP